MKKSPTKPLGATSYKETAFGIIPRSKLLKLEIEGTKKGLEYISNILKTNKNASITPELLLTTKIQILLSLKNFLKREVHIIEKMDGYSMEDFYIPCNLYGFALSRLTAKILWRLKSLNMCYEVWPNNINHYLEMLIHDQPRNIVGLGTYSGIDQDFIRIETLTKNQFRNNTIEKGFPTSMELLIKPFVKQVPQTKFTSALGNSWCNLVSWKIVRLIENKTLNSQYAFLHIPKSFGFQNALRTIEIMLS